MTISVGMTDVGSTTTGASVTSAGKTTQATGSCIVVAYAFVTARNFVSIADNKGNSANYARIGTELVGSYFKSGMFYCENVAGGAGHTVTVTADGSGPTTVFVLEILGAKTTGAFDKFSRIEDTVSPFTSGATATTTTDDELLVGAYFGGGANPIVLSISGATPASGWTIQTGAQELDGSSKYSGSLATAIVSAKDAYTAGFADTTDTVGSVWIATFAAAAGAAVSITLMGQAVM
jgi:hypothetical protein